MTLKPQLKFGTNGHNVTFLLNVNQITIWAAAAPEAALFHQGIEIPLHYLIRLTIRSKDGSQNPNGLANVHLELNSDLDHPCYLDSVATAIEQVAMIMRLEDVLGMAGQLSKLCPQVEIDDEPSEGESADFFDQQESMNRPASQSIEQLEPLGFGDNEYDESASNIPPSDIEEHEAHDPAKVTAIMDLESVDSRSDNVEADIIPEAPKPLAKASSSVKANSQKRGGVKPKAKLPLMLGQNGNNADSFKKVS